jgi:hypothetical protein
LTALTKGVKLAITTSLISLIIYISYILRGSFVILSGYLANVPQDVGYVRMTGLVFWLGLSGLIGRFIAVILGLAAIYILWVRSEAFIKVKGLVVAALLLEGIYYLSLAPSVWFLLRPGFVSSLSLGVSYLLQILLTAPMLWLLAAKTATYRAGNRRSLMPYGAVVFVGYITALAVNQVSRWTSMISVDSLRFLLQGIRMVGFLDAMVLMPLAVVLAVIGAYRLFQYKMRSAMLWLGASLAVVGINYLIYVVYSYLTASLNSLSLVDVWTVPFVFLGIALMINAKKIQDGRRCRRNTER